MSAFPLRYAHGNILFGRGEERLALYRGETISYPFMPEREKIEWLRRLAQFAFAAEADFSLWRVCRAYPAERYVEQALPLLDDRMQRQAAWLRYLEGHELHLRGLASHVTEVYLGVSLCAAPPPSFGGALLRASDRARRRLEDLFGVAAPQPVSARELDALLAAEERTFGRIGAAFGQLVRRASTGELQWLLRRAATRGVGEPRVDPHWEPDALVIEGETGEILYEPLETDLARHANEPLFEEDRTLVCDSESGRSFQAMLALGALPEEAAFPGEAELLCIPLEAVDFPVDAVLHALDGQPAGDRPGAQADPRRGQRVLGPARLGSRPAVIPGRGEPGAGAGAGRLPPVPGPPAAARGLDLAGRGRSLARRA